MTSDQTPNEAFVTLPPTGADLDHFDPKYMGVHVVLPGPLLPPKPVRPPCDECGLCDNPDKCTYAGVSLNRETNRYQCVDCRIAWENADMAKWMPASVLLRRADDVAFMSPEVLREKLRQVNYRPPAVTQPSQCCVDGCPHLTIDTICWECQVHIDARVEDARLRLERRRANAAFWPALLMILALLALLFYAASQAGSTLRAWGWL